MTEMKSLSPKQIQVQLRLEEIEMLLAGYRAHVKLLHAYAEGRETLKGKGCTDSAARYQRTEEDERRLPLTLQNLKGQMALLTREREVLIQYAL